MLLDPIKLVRKLIKFISRLAKNILGVWQFFFLLIVYFIFKFFQFLSERKFLPQFIKTPTRKLGNLFQKLADILDRGGKDSIPQQSIIRLSIRNMLQKKTRSLITIGGMSIGVAAIVFLVSIGYGLQGLVVSRVAELKEMKQADAMPSQASNLFLDDKTLAQFKQIPQIESAHPLISLVGQVSFKNSITDVVVYGATTDYLEQSAVRPVKGNFFDSRILARQMPKDNFEIDHDQGQNQGEVAGEMVQKAKLGTETREIDFNIHEGEWIRVRKKPGTNNEILGYTRRLVGVQNGVEVWGSSYIDDEGLGKIGIDDQGEPLGKWIKAKVPLWTLTECNQEELGCEDSQYLKQTDEEGNQTWETGYFAQINLTIEQGLPMGEVLGETEVATTAAEDAAENLTTVLSSTDAAELEIFEFLEQATQSAEEKKEIIPLGKKAEKQAVINRSMAQILGLESEEAVNSKFNLKFVVVGDLIPEKKGKKLETEFEQYRIVGIIPGEKNPVVWVPFIDLRSLGIERFSQAKLVVANQNTLSEARKQVEALGFKTSSVADTVAKINNLFSTARVLLLSLGMIALVVAALGMFNTLTVSLLERTREVGVMKAMGVKSREVRDLFLTESMIMGVLGGVFGIFLGWLAGKVLSMVLSLFAVFKGAGSLDISFIPMFFVFIVIFLSLLVGFITGFYPARRATKISALNALRYE